MENREIRLFNWRLFNWIGPRVTGVLPVVAATVLAFAFSSNVAANGCDPTLSGEPAIYQTSVQIRGQNPARNTFVVSATADLMVFARERGADVTLEVLDSTGQVIGRGDNPIRRTGVQRVVLPAVSGQRYYIAVTGKDHWDSNGSVELRVVDLHRTADSACRDAQRLLAKADAAYASGQAVSRSTVNTPGVSSDKSYQEASTGYQSTATNLDASGPSLLLAQAQLAAASLLNEVDSFAEGMKWAARAAQTYASVGDDYGKARAQAIEGSAALDVAATLRKAGATDAAKQADVMLAATRDQLHSVVAFHTARRELYDAALAQNDIGISFYYQGRYDDAIRAYQKALPLYERLHEHRRQAQVLQNVALVEYELGRISESLPHFRQALSLIKPETDPRLFAKALSNSSLANWASGNYDLALHQLSESLTLTRAIQDTYSETLTLNNIAGVYASFGDQARALEFYRRVLARLDIAQNYRLRTQTLRAIANILRQQGHAEEALRMDREALSIAATAAAKSRITVQIAKDLLDLNNTREAAQNLQAVLDPTAASDEVDRARALSVRARLRAAAGDPAAAEADLNAALTTFKTYELPTDEFDIWLALARSRHERGAIAEAFAAVDQALALAEEVRLQSANPELRSTLLQPLRPAFDLKVAMLFEQSQAASGKLREVLATRALETAEQARARALSDYQTLDTTAPGLDPKLLERRQTLYRELAARRLRLEVTLDRTGAADSRSLAIRSEMATLRQDLDQIDAKIGAASQTARNHRPAGQKSTSLPLGNIPAGVAVIEYWIGSKDSFAWVATRNAVTMTRLGASAQINSEADALHTALRGFGAVPRSARLDAGERLYASVMGAIEPQVNGMHTLIFAPDGALHYVPFATLRHLEAGKKEFLIANHDIAVTPSIQMFLQPETRQSTANPSRRMLLVDDPVYDSGDPRVANRSAPLPDADPKISGPALALVRGSDGGRSLPRLPGAAREAAAIATLMPPGSVDRLEGFAATRERFLTSSLDRYRLIHVASHATTDPEIPQASALILSTVDESGREIDGRVLAADFLGIRLHADTVVLSACDTALGKSVAGEGLIGLQYIVLARGARSVVSSLWPAIDRVTADVMVKFYSALLSQHATVISAWSTASRAALAGPNADPGASGAFMLTLSHVQDVSSL